MSKLFTFAHSTGPGAPETNGRNSSAHEGTRPILTEFKNRNLAAFFQKEVEDLENPYWNDDENGLVDYQTTSTSETGGQTTYTDGSTSTLTIPEVLSPAVLQDPRHDVPPVVLEEPVDEFVTVQRDPNTRLISNVDREVRDLDEGKPKTVYFAKSMPEIRRAIFAATGGYPCAARGKLFFYMPKSTDEAADTSEVSIVGSAIQFQAALLEFSQVYFHCGRTEVKGTGAAVTPPSVGVIFESLVQNPKRQYNGGISFLPHHPPLDGVFYVPWTNPEVSPEGGPLKEFMDALNPETEEDRVLLLAALCSQFWGGPQGSRPVFLLTCRQGIGTGSGKSTTVRLLSLVSGGTIDIPPDGNMDTLITRLLSPGAEGFRVLSVDNLKGNLDNSRLEALVTSKTLSGRELYKGEGQIDNNFTVFLNTNSPDLSHDLAERAVVIHLGAPKTNCSFIGQWTKFINDNRDVMVSQIIATLRRDPVCQILPENEDRFAEWQRGVMSRLEGGNAAAALYLGRRKSVDTVALGWQDVSEAVVSAVSRRHPDHATSRLFLTTNQIFYACYAASLFLDGESPGAFARRLAGAVRDGYLPGFEQKKTTNFNGYVVRGENAAVDAELITVMTL